jgi:integrase
MAVLSILAHLVLRDHTVRGGIVSKGSLFKRGSVWQFRRTVDGVRRTVSLGVTAKPDALLARDRILAQDAASQIDSGKLRAGQAWSVFEGSLCRSDCSPATMVGYEAQWARFVDRLTDSLDLAHVTRGHVSEYLTGLKSEVGASTWNKHLNCLKYVWRTIQVETGATLPDVFLGVRALPVPLVRHEAFTLDQVRSLYASVQGEMQDLIGFAAHTGLRRVDAVLFDKSSYDPVEGLIRVQPRKTARISAEAVLAPSRLVLDVLQRRMDSDSRYLFPEVASVYSGCPQTVGARFQRHMVKALALNGSRGLYGFHSFRHWFRTTLTEKSVPDAVINAMICHGQGEVSARYVHPSPDVLREAADKLPELRVETD